MTGDEPLDEGIVIDVICIIQDETDGIMMHSISTTMVGAELCRWKLLRDRLLAEIPGLDAETLADTLEGITDLKEMVAEVIRSALDDEALVAGLSTRLSDMKARLERLETRAKRKRQLVLKTMGEADMAKLEQPDFTASLRQAAPTLEVVAEDKIPAAYWKPQPFKLDRQGLLQALKAGTAIDGACFASPQQCLSVRCHATWKTAPSAPRGIAPSSGSNA